MVDLPHLFCILHMLWSAKLVLSLSFFPIDDKRAILEVLGYSTRSSHLQLKYWLYLTKDYSLQVWFVGSPGVLLVFVGGRNCNTCPSLPELSHLWWPKSTS